MVSGEINPYAMTRTSNNSQIDLPFRLLSLKIDRSFSSFDLKTSTGLEYRYKEWAGLYKSNESQIYVNRGLGHLGYAGRVGIMPDISILSILF